MTKTCEGIVMRQTKITGGRRMILVFTREEGKISAGTHISEKSKGGAALALRPFAHGWYTIFEKSADIRTITAAETIDSYFSLGEDMGRFAEASFVLEFTDKLLPEGVHEPEIFGLLNDCLGMLAVRKTGFGLPTISYMIKVLQALGVFPDEASLAASDLLSGLNGDILEAAIYISSQPLKRMETLTLEIEKERAVFKAIRAYSQKYLDLGTIKSERMLAGNI